MFRRSTLTCLLGILLLGVLLPVRSAAQSEGIIIRESFYNADLQQAFVRLEEKYELKIAYEHEAIRGKKVSARLRAKNVEEAFTQLLQNTQLEFQMAGPRRVLIRPAAGTTLSQTDPKIPQAPKKVLLSGTIQDALNAAPLPYANVYCDNGAGTTTDETGAFQLDLEAADFPLSLRVSYIGYMERRIDVDTTSRRLRLELVPQIQELAGIDVFESKPTIAQVSYRDATEISVQHLSSLPSFVGGQDLFRDLQLLPGISAYEDLSANFSVRGGHESENMIILDGITLFNVDHYFGIFSAVNPNIVDKVTIYKNAFPSEHGGRTASVIDIRSNTPSLLKPEGEVDINLLTTSAVLEVPLGKQAGMLLSGRTTNADIANGQLFDVLEQDSRVDSPRENPLLEATRSQLTAIEPDFRFYDLNAKLFWQPAARTNLAASFFAGYDDFAYSFDNNIRIPLRRSAIESATRYRETATWRNRGLSLELNHEWNATLSSHWVAGHSFYENNNLLDYNLDYATPNRSDSIRVNNLTDNSIRGLDANFKNTWQIRKNQSLDFGLQLTQHEVDFLFTLNDRNILQGDQKAQQNALYLQYQSLSRDGRFHFQAGLRQNFYNLIAGIYLSPRLSASYQLNDRWLVKGAWSKYYQFLRESTHETALGRTSNFWVLANERRFPVSSSINRMLGLRYIHPFFDVDVEFYDRKMVGVVEYAQVFTGLSAEDGKPPRRNFVFFTGEGRTRGVDVLLKKTTGPYTGWLAYTLSKSTNSFPQIDQGAPFPAQNDRRHQLQLIQQYQWKNWNFALTYVFTSGRPYTDLALLSEDVRDRRELTAQDRVSYLDDYHRVDIGANYQFKLWRGQAELGASIFNLLDRQNVKYRQYIYNLRDVGTANRTINTVLGAELQMLRFTPNLRFSWRF